MRTMQRWFCVVSVVVVSLGTSAVGVGAAATPADPPWVVHVRNYPGGISNGVRAMISPEAQAARARFGSAGAVAAPAQVAAASLNVQMNDDTLAAPSSE